MARNNIDEPHGNGYGDPANFLSVLVPSIVAWRKDRLNVLTLLKAIKST
jgi:hypothetical protein